MRGVLSTLLAAVIGVASAGSQPAPPKATKPVPPVSPPPVIEGVVTGPDGRPVEGALVMARAAQARRIDVPVSARTDARGSFRVTLKRKGPHDVRAEAKGLAARSLERVRPGSPVKIVLQKGRFVEGTVRDAVTGQPVARARVDARENGSLALPSDPTAGLIEAWTDQKGRFRLEGVRDALHLLSAVASGYGRAFKSGIAPGRAVALYLTPGSTLRGTVWGPDKKPVEGAAVFAESVAPRPAALRPEITDVAGRFEIMGVAPGAYRLVVRHKDHAAAVLSSVFVTSNSEERVDVALERAVPVVGRLVGPERERTIAGQVMLAEMDGQPVPWSVGDTLRAETGPDGRFRLDAIPPGEHLLVASASGYATRRVEMSVRAGSPRADVGDIVLESGIRIRGKVKDKAGSAIGDARVVAVPARRRPAAPAATAEARSDPDGSFAVGGLAPGPYRLGISAPGFGEAERPAEAGAENVEIVLSPAGTITGVVVDENGQPVEAFRAVARSPSREGRGGHMSAAEATAHPEGRFTLEDLGEGMYMLEVSAPEHASATASDVNVRPGTTTDVGLVRLAAGVTVKGTVVDIEGAAVAGATVTMRGQRGFPLAGDFQADSDMTGAFEIRGVPAGTMDVTASHPSFAEGRVSGIEVDPAKATSEVRVVLSPGGRIEGAVRQRDGRGVPGALIQFQPESGEFLFPGDTMVPVHSDGSFVLEHVPAGRGLVVVMRGSAGRYTSSEHEEIEVRDGETTTVDFVIREVLVSGRVRRAGVPVPDLYLTIRPRSAFGGSVMVTGRSAPPPSSQPQKMTGITREDGAYALLLDSPGTADLSIETVDGRSGFPGRTVDIPDLDTHTLDVDLSGVSVAGIVVEKDTDLPIGQAGVSAVSPKKSSANAVTGADGRFQLELDPGDYQVFAKAEEAGYGGAQASVTVEPTGAPEIRLALSRGLSISGKAVDPAGRGIGGTMVLARGGEGSSQSGGLAQTLPDGSFAMGGLDSGPHDLTAVSSAGAFAAKSGVAAGAKDVVLTLRPGGRVRLQVIGPGALPLPGALAAVAKLDGLPFPAPEHYPTDALGVVEMPAPAGSVEIRVSKGPLWAVVTVGVFAGETAAAVVSLAEAEATGTP